MNGGSTDDTCPELKGTGAEAGSLVTIYDNGEGEHNLTVSSTDKAANEGPHSGVYTIIVGATALQAPEIKNLSDDVAPVICAVAVDRASAAFNRN